MLKFKRGEIRINGVATQGYRVEGLDNSIFRGLQVAVVKYGERWHAYEATTGGSITPSSWSGGLSNKTRAGVIQIVSHYLSNAPQTMWDRVQAEIDYDLSIPHTELTQNIEPDTTEQTIVARVSYTGWGYHPRPPCLWLTLGDEVTQILIEDKRVKYIKKDSIVKCDLVDIKHLADQYWEGSLKAIEIV